MSELSGPAVRYEVAEGVATLTMNRPESLNALSEEMQDGLADTLSRADADREVVAVLLTGAGRGFCSGGDVKGMASRDATPSAPVPGKELETWEDASIAARRMHDRIVMRLYELSKPTIAVVNGAAAGAGFGLACACDLRVASEKAFFTTAFARVGRSGDFGTSFFVRQLVGPSMARQLFFLSERITAERALELGIVSSVHPADEAVEKGTELARQIAQGPRRAFSRMKRALRASDEGDLRKVLEIESMNMVLSGRSAEGRAFLQSFLAGRQSS